MGWTVTSPDGQVAISLDSSNQGLTYRVLHHGEEVIATSPLGLRTSNGDIGPGVSVDDEGSDVAVSTDAHVLHGKRHRVVAEGVARTVWFDNVGSPDPTAGQGRFGVELRAYDQGAALRYLLEGSGEVTFTGELTAARVAPGRAWIQPMQPPAGHCYEDYYTDGVPIGTASGTDAWYLPATFATGSSWLCMHEADLDASFYGAKLAPEAPDRTYSFVGPHPEEGLGIGAVDVTARLPWHSPWRTFTLADSAVGLLETDLVDVLSPEPEGDFGYVKPGRATWSWWSEHSSPTNIDRLRDFVLLAEEFGYEYTLVDANWQENGEPAIRGLIDDANAAGVGVWLWYNSGGPHNAVSEAPRDLMYDSDLRKAELAKIASWGAVGVKVDFFHSDKADRIQQYLDIVADAHSVGLMVNFHGSTVPRGWSRTWPNLMSMEAVHGAEQYGVGDFETRAPCHNTVLPFTRNLAGPMDYTPVTFTDERPDKLTTDAHELALAVVFESGVLHVADSDTALHAADPAVQEALKVIPADWDEIVGIEGEPSRYVVLARRSGDRWFVAGLNGTGAVLAVRLDLAVISGGSGTWRLVTDGADRHEVTTGQSSGQITVAMAANGGFLAYEEK
jgi:alpha-glucosidase